MLMHRVNASRLDCDRICQTTSVGGSHCASILCRCKCNPYNLLPLGSLQPTVVSVTGPSVILSFEKELILLDGQTPQLTLCPATH